MDEIALDDEVIEYIAQDSRQAAVQVLDVALEAGASLATLSERGRIVSELNDPAIREVFVLQYATMSRRRAAHWHVRPQENRGMHMKRICVFAGSSLGVRGGYNAVAKELGRALAQRDVSLIYGGARVGLMGALADAVLAARGHVTGIIPEALVAKEVAHNGLSELRVVGSMHERKAMMADLADGFIALPGGWGTVEEFFEILTWGQLGLHRKPCGLLNVQGYFDRLLSFVEHSIEEGFVQREYRSMISVSSSPGPLLDMLTAYEAPMVEKWIGPAAT